MNHLPLAPHAKVEVDELHLAKMRLELAHARYVAAENADDRIWNEADDALSFAKIEFRRILADRSGMDAEAIYEALSV